MTAVTLAVAAFVSLLIIRARPARAFGIYVVLLLWYPSYLVVTIGTIDISAGRICIAVLLAKCLSNKALMSRFKWCALDTWLMIAMIIYVVVTCVTRPFAEALENRSGFVMDTWFAYLVARFCISDRAALIKAAKLIGLGVVPLALLGITETLTGWQPFIPLTRYCPWWRMTFVDDMRWGFYRAVGPFGHSIMYGVSLAMFLPLVYCLRHERDHWRRLSWFLSVVILFGVLSSMSSGPWIMAIITVGCLALEHDKRWVKLLMVGFVLGCLVVQITSNRHFYYVLFDRMNPAGGGSWHRARLIDCAIMHFDEWYLAGYGGRDPGWGPDLGGFAHTDITNEFILAGVNYGLLGLIAFTTVLVSAIRKVVRLHNKSSDPLLRSWCWALGSILVALVPTFLSVSFFGQPISFFYCLLGIVGSSASLRQGYVIQISGEPARVSSLSEMGGLDARKGL